MSSVVHCALHKVLTGSATRQGALCMVPACSWRSRSCKQLLLFSAGPANAGCHTLLNPLLGNLYTSSLHSLDSSPTLHPSSTCTAPSLPPPLCTPPRLNCTCCVSCASGLPQRSMSAVGRSHTAGSGSRSRRHTHAHGCRQGVMAEGGIKQWRKPYSRQCVEMPSPYTSAWLQARSRGSEGQQLAE